MRPEFAQSILEKVCVDYDTIADEFSATREGLTWPETTRFREFVDNGAHILDIGCGNGRAYQLFEGMAIAYDGIDVSGKLVAHARRLNDDILTEFMVGSMMAIPNEADQYDAAVALAVFHHIPSEQFRVQALREALRVLKPGGWLLMTNWSRWQPKDIRLHIEAMMRKLSGSGYDMRDLLVPWKRGKKKVERYYHAFTTEEIRRLCEKVGFQVWENYYANENGKVSRWKAKNIITICKKPEPAPQFEDGWVTT